MKTIRALTGPLAGSTYDFGASCVIGRDGDADIQLLDEGVSRRHACVVENEDGSISAVDLGSINGTTVNGQRISASKLAKGDKLEIGSSTFVFEEAASDEVQVDVPDIKLTSGPAVEETVAGDERAMMAELRKRLAAAAAAPKAPCCDSPLASRARDESWAFCPGCGGAISA